MSSSMNVSTRASIGILIAALIGTLWFLVQVMPHWQVPSVLATLIAISTGLVIARKPIGFSLAQFGLFCLFLLGVVYVIGDPEGLDPWPRYTAVSPYMALVAICLIFLACVTVLRKANADMRRSIHGQEA